MGNKILFAISEAFPFAKTGGLGDVGFSLPRSLSKRDDVEVVLPLYRSIEKERYGIVRDGEAFEMEIGEIAYRVEFFRCVYMGLTYRFIYIPLLCERDYLYGDPGSGYEDNPLRFGLFSHAIIRMLRQDRYDLVHLNDWQCALVALLVDADPTVSVKTLFTIHNLAYQGIGDFSLRDLLGIEVRYCTMEGIEFYGQMNLMKAGIAYSDAITTVSPTYAREILSAEYGCGLDGFLKVHRKKLSGILNGLDVMLFDPSSDALLQYPFKTIAGKKKEKASVLKQFSLTGIDKPLFVFIGRFAWQKGIDLLIEVLPKLSKKEVNIIILGEGEASYASALHEVVLEAKNIRLIERYDESLAHRLYGAADFLMMPSLFEPCGLNQLIAFRYGLLPIVRETGGLKDSVQKLESFDPQSSEGFGIRFLSPTPKAFLNGCLKGLEWYESGERFRQILTHNMGVDVSWEKSATLYHHLYEKLRY